MTKQECAVVMAYTGIVMLTGDNLRIYYKYLNDIMGRPVYTHELAFKEIKEKIKEKSTDDFLKLCREASNALEQQSWIPVSERLPKESDGAVLITVNGEVNTGRYSEFSNTWYKGDMRGVGGDDPIAWQPLPKPYEEKRGSEND